MKHYLASIFVVVPAILVVTSTNAQSQESPSATQVISEPPPFDTLSNDQPVGRRSEAPFPPQDSVISEPPPGTLPKPNPKRPAARPEPNRPGRGFSGRYELPPRGDMGTAPRYRLPTEPFQFDQSEQPLSPPTNHDSCEHDHDTPALGTPDDRAFEPDPRPGLATPSFPPNHDRYYVRDDFADTNTVCPTGRCCGGSVGCPLDSNRASSSRSLNYLSETRPYVARDAASLDQAVVQLARVIDHEFRGLRQHSRLSRELDVISDVAGQLRKLETARATVNDLIAEAQGMVNPIRTLGGELQTGPQAEQSLFALRDLARELLAYARELNQAAPLDSRSSSIDLTSRHVPYTQPQYQCRWREPSRTNDGWQSIPSTDR
jgi:hypothetical protein